MVVKEVFIREIRRLMLVRYKSNQVYADYGLNHKDTL